MSASGLNNRRRRRRGDSEEHEAGAGMERWLLTYSDMITLLLALFIVLWSISSVNISKYSALKESLRAAFAGKVLPGNPAVLQGGTSILQSAGAQTPTIQPQPQSIQSQLQSQISAQLARQDLQNLRHIQQMVQAYAREHGLTGRLQTSIDERGLVIRVLTDDLLFATGQAVLERRSQPLLTRIAALLLQPGIPNAVRVEGNTDSVPISTPEFRSNWELSTARATAVLQYLLARGIPPSRLSVAGYADQRPIATDATAAGRALNRRVDLVVLRRALTGSEDTLP